LTQFIFADYFVDLRFFLANEALDSLRRTAPQGPPEKNVVQFGFFEYAIKTAFRRYPNV
jgi:hypothetical protein